MTQPFGNHDVPEMRPGDTTGRYWSAPPCQVRVDDGKNVTWIELKRPYALIGSHQCCTLRIRGSHVPDVAYFVCCLRDRVEIWPTAAIAFPRWGAIHSDLQVIVGPCSLTFHSAGESQGHHVDHSFLADSEIETRLSWPGREFPKKFRRPVTIIGDDHPSVLRLHGRGLDECQFAAVVQNQSIWMVNLAARRMQRSERVCRFSQAGESFSLGDATLHFIAATPHELESEHEDSGIGIGTEDPSSDLHAGTHSGIDIHGEDAHSGMSGIASQISSSTSDPSSSFISHDARGDSDGPAPSSNDSLTSEPTTTPDDEEGNQQGGNSTLCLIESSPDQAAAAQDSVESETVESLDSVAQRVDSASHDTPPPVNADIVGESAAVDDSSSTDAALSLVDTALGLVDAAVDASDREVVARQASDQENPDREPSFTPPPASDRDFDSAAGDDSNHVLEPELRRDMLGGGNDSRIDSEDTTETESSGVLDFEATAVDPFGSSDVKLTGHDPPLVVDRPDSADASPTLTYDDEASIFGNGTSPGSFESAQEPDVSQANRRSDSVDDFFLHLVDDTLSGSDATADPPELDPRERSDSEPDAIIESEQITPDHEAPSRPVFESPESQADLVDPDCLGDLEEIAEEPLNSTIEKRTIENDNQSEDHEMGRLEPATESTPNDENLAQVGNRVIESEALTSHVTSRLTEIGSPRTLPQQIIRWTAITLGIVIPSIVIYWLIQRIYSDMDLFGY